MVHFNRGSGEKDRKGGPNSLLIIAASPCLSSLWPIFLLTQSLLAAGAARLICIPFVGFRQCRLERVITGKACGGEPANVIGAIEKAIWLAVVPDHPVAHPGVACENLNDIADFSRIARCEICFATAAVSEATT